jgi:hypothetical protein
VDNVVQAVKPELEFTPLIASVLLEVAFDAPKGLTVPVQDAQPGVDHLALLLDQTFGNSLHR